MELGVGADVYYTVKFNSGVCMVLHDSYGIYKVHPQKWILKKRTRTLQWYATKKNKRNQNKLHIPLENLNMLTHSGMLTILMNYH